MMNKFLKRKANRARELYSATIFIYAELGVRFDGLKNNRDYNKVLRLLRSLPKDCLLCENPAIVLEAAEVLRLRNQTQSDVTVNNQFGVVAPPLEHIPWDEVVKRKLAKRSENKNEYTARKEALVNRCLTRTGFLLVFCKLDPVIFTQLLRYAPDNVLATKLRELDNLNNSIPLSGT